ncbi:MAG: IS1380 family transposase [bacterium]
MKIKKKIRDKEADKIKVNFSGGRLTNYSGILPLFKFMKKLRFFGMLEENVSIPMGSNALYSNGQILSSIILGVFSGLNRICKIETFSRDPLVQKLLKLPKHIDEDTIIWRLKQFGFRQSNELSEVSGGFSKKVHRRLRTREDMIDLDSTVRGVYGNQEGASKGFNPNKHGQKSYHPLMAFLNSTRECLLSWLRPGDVHTSHNALEFLKQLFAMLPDGLRRLTLRADSGFFSDKILSLIESFGYYYLIKVKLKNLNQFLCSKEWEAIAGMHGWFMCEFEHIGTGWSAPRRFVALKRLRGIQTEGVLFPMFDYEYFCYVTNIQQSPLYLHSLYGDRGESENWIEAVKNQLFAGWLLTDSFWANEALWQCSVLAYNLSLWMRILTEPKSWHEEPNTFRLWFVQLAGRLVTSARQAELKLYNAYHHKRKWLKINHAVEALQLC